MPKAAFAVFALALLPFAAIAQTVSVSPNALVFNATVGGAAPAPQVITITSTAGALSFTITPSGDAPWIKPNVATGQTPGPVSIAVDPSGLAAGIYNGTVRVGSAVAAFQSVVVPVTLNISPGLTASSSSLTFNYQIGGAAVPAQAVTIGSSGAPLTFTVTPTTNSSGSWLTASPGSGTTPVNLNVAVNTSGLNPGTYTGTVTVTSTGSATTSTLKISVTLVVSPSNPTITAVQNSATFQNSAVAPGEIITISGSGLGPSVPLGLALDSNGKVATLVGGVQVLIGGVAAPLIYVSAPQINAVVPYEVQGLVNPTVQVKYQGQTSTGFGVVPAATAPALYTANVSGTGPAAALNQDLTYNTPNTPAPKGGVVVLYMTGEGQTAPAGVTGKVTAVSATPPLTPQPILPVAALINGVPAAVLFYGEAPQYVSGVMQVNLQIPANVPSGNVPVIISVGGNSTQNGVTIAVQ